MFPKKKETWTQAHRTMPRDDGRRERSGAAANRGEPRIAGNHPKAGRGKEGFYSESQREHGPADTLILDP